MNNVNVDRKRACTGCFACSEVCKFNAINIIQDEDGFFGPFINDRLCTNCGMCKKVCYSHIDIPNENYNLKGYYGWHKNPKILNMSASGGITTAISQVALDNGYVVIGCSYNLNEKKAKHIVVTEQADIIKILGSKYFQSDLSEMYQEVKSFPKDAKMVFFGTPCQVSGIKEFLKIRGHNIENVILVELFCHGITSQLVWKSYMEECSIDKITDVRFRTKDYGWHVPVNEIITDKKVIPTKKSGDDFFTAYYSTEFFNKSCYDCEVKRNLRNSDLRIGDFWGKRFSENKKGVSCIISSTQKGEQLLEECKKYFELFDGDLDEILNGQSYNKNHLLDEDKRMENFLILKKYGLKYSLKNINKRKPLPYRLKKRAYSLVSNFRSKFYKN